MEALNNAEYNPCIKQLNRTSIPGLYLPETSSDIYCFPCCTGLTQRDRPTYIQANFVFFQGLQGMDYPKLFSTYLYFCACGFSINPSRSDVTFALT